MSALSLALPMPIPALGQEHPNQDVSDVVASVEFSLTTRLLMNNKEIHVEYYGVKEHDMN